MEKADLIFKNGDIYTVDPRRSTAEAVAVQGNKIVYVGNSQGAEPFVGEKSKVIDLKGKMLLPGFVEAHAHPFMATCWLSGIVIDMQSSYEEVLLTIQKYIEEHPDKKAYYGIGYDENVVKFHGGTRKEVLDRICRDKPILLQGSGGHEGWVNSKALECTGISQDIGDPIPGFSYFRRDEDGNPTGGLVEMAAIKAVTNGIKPFDSSLVVRVLQEILSNFNALGITTVADCGIAAFLSGYIYPVIQDMLDQSKMTFRTVGCYLVGEDADVDTGVANLKLLGQKYNSDIFRVNTLKIINDGTVESRSASFFEAYGDGGSCEPFMGGKRLGALCVDAAKAGFDINIHGIGDRAIHENLMAAKAVREAGYLDTRFTNSHTQYVQKKDRKLFGKYNVIANTSGAWHVEYGPNHVALGEERTNDIFTMKSIINGGGMVTLGSDFPVDEIGNEPLKGLEMSVTRKAFGEKDFPVLQPTEEALTVEEAIAAYTINGAYQIHMEDKIGSVEVGKYADFVVLENNLFSVEKHCIHQVPIWMTVMNGEIVYQREKPDGGKK
jgi:predicted amidohydrolase YtcJ